MSCFKKTLTLLAIVVIASSTLTAGEPVRLTDDGTNKRDPIFVDGGKTLVYCYDETTALIRMMTMTMADRSIKPMFSDAGDKHHLEPSISPDRKWIVYTQCTGNLTARLVIRSLVEKKESYITHGGRGGTRSPAFSPNSKLIVYAFAETGPQQLWSVDTNGQQKKQITQTEGVSNWPTFTPDGKSIVFANSRENNYEIYSMKLDGTKERRLTNNRLMDIRPSISPDGKRIAFVSTRDGNYEVYVMNFDGTGVTRITNSEERDDYPSWHPNGRQLVMVSERDGLFDLYLVDVPTAKVALK